jgi:cullin-associated NEDD8-dissociated protein 1
LLQDVALDSLLAFFKQLVVSNAVEFQDLLFLFRQRLNVNVSKQGVYHLAKCIAVITATGTKENGEKVLGEIFTLLEAADTPSAPESLREVQLSLLITGDLGRMFDLSTIDGVAERLKGIYINYFDSPSEELRQAASYALGNASVGSQASFLPLIVSKLDEENKKQQYLLLSALREFIQSSFRLSGGDGIAASLPVILPPLEKHCADGEEGVRTMVAECMGSLVCLQPGMLMPKLVELQNAHSKIVAPEGTIDEDDLESQKNARVCWTVATSIKLAIAGKLDSSQLSTFMPSFVKLLDVKELNVRLAALLMIYSTVHHMPQVVVSTLADSVLPALFEVADLKLERKVDLGPFTHKVDDALPLRKAALSIFATCLDSLPGSMDIPAFMPVLAKSLADAEDIQLHAHQIIIWMCSRQPTYLVASIETFCEPLEKNINKKPGQKTGTELERLNDWIKSALRVMLTLSKLEGTMSSRVFSDFAGRINGNSKFTPIIESLEES